jgi:hypothetical protein
LSTNGHFSTPKGKNPVPNFRTVLPAPSAHQGYDIRRTPATATLAAIVTSENFLCCDTHYYAGRTTPCERITNERGQTTDDSMCPACTRKQPWRTHVYVSCFNPKTHEHFLFECTANAAKTFAEHVQIYKTLRGFAFAASRPKGGVNAKVVIQAIPVNLANITLPKPPDIPRALAVIWRLPSTAIDTQPETIDGLHDHEGYAFAADHVRTDPQPLAEMRNQLDDACEDGDIEQRRRDFLAQMNNPPPKTAKKTNGKPKCETATPR